MGSDSLMGRLIREFFGKRKEKKYWQTRLEPYLDRLILERKRMEEHVMQEETGQVEVPPGALMQNQQEGEIESSDRIEQIDPEQIMMSSQDSQTVETTEVPDEEESASSDPKIVFPELCLDDLLVQLMQEQTKGGDFRDDEQEEAILLPNRPLEELMDSQVDKLKPLLHQLVRRNAKGERKQRTLAPAPRRKNVDPRGTIRQMARNGGYFAGFRYLPSPTEKQAPVDLQRLLVIADVSGSMGRYVGIVLFLLACLEGLAEVDSYVFSDETTYASQLLGEGPFEEHYARLKEGAASWEYGTQLAKALQDVLADGLFDQHTRVVLITDGGFSLVGSDWVNTVKGIREIQERVERFYVVTPTRDLYQDGPYCEEKLWNVERDPREGYEIVGMQQRIARFGLLTRYSDRLLFLQSADELVSLIQLLLEDEGP